MLPGTMIPRPRLIESIASPTQAPLTLVTAPAGYGKSTAVEQWASETNSRVAWVPLGRVSNSPDRFSAQVATAIAGSLPDETDGPADATFESILDRLFEISRRGETLSLIFDDYQVIENSEIHEVMDGLLDRLPDGIHVILLSRTIPLLALGKLYANGHVRHLTEADLGFTRHEIESICNQAAPGRLTESQLDTLAQRTDGWIAGIRLALASIEQVDGKEVQSIVDAWPVSRWLDEYIVEEVLEALPDEVRQFVLATVILSELNPELCDEALGIQTSARLLDEVRRRLVFVRPAGSKGEGLTYHALFAESVRDIAARHIPAGVRRERHRRAAQWYADRGNLEAATEHAAQAKDWDMAERFVRPLASSLMDTDRSISRLYWLRKLPIDRILADPHMARWYISALLYAGRGREGQRALARVDPAWRASGDPVQLGYSASCRCMVATMNGELDTALELAYEALSHYPEEYHVDRMHAWCGAMQFEFAKGNDERAAYAYHQALPCRDHLPSEQWWWTTITEPERVNQQAIRGNLHTAHRMYLDAIDDFPAIYRPHVVRLRYKLAAISLEWNRLDDALNECAMIEGDLAMLPEQIWHQDVRLVLARIYHAAGDTEAAERTLRELRSTYNQHGGRRLLHRMEAVQATIWLETGRAELARQWASHVAIGDGPWVREFGDIDPRAVRARAFVAEGDYALADSTLQVLIEQAVTAKLWVELVSLSMWHGATRASLGDEATARETIRTALTHGQRSGIIRSFATPGHDLTDIVGQVGSEMAEIDPAYLRSVMEFLSEGQASPATRARLASDSPLSARESEVLTLLQQGYSNREIADDLFITERTAKKHVGNILRKLGVANRTAAVAQLSTSASLRR